MSVFRDVSGRRWARAKRGAIILGSVVTTLAAVIVLSILTTAPLPDAPANAVTRAALRARWPTVHPAIAVTRAERARLTARRRLFAALEKGGGYTRRPRAHTGPAGYTSGFTPAASRSAGEVAGFYVNWDDNSLASLRTHAAQMDYVVCEWAFVAPAADSLRLAVDRRVLALTQDIAPNDRPRVLLMVSNFDSARSAFDAGPLRKLLRSPVARRRAIGQLATAVRQFGLGGVTVDFEEVPDDVRPLVVRFVGELRQSLAATGAGALVTQAVPPDLPSAYLRRLAALNDRVFVMLYDEHYALGDPGPVASQSWYVDNARAVTRVVPPGKLILVLGAYGYDWNDGDTTADEMTFHDVMTAARDNQASAHFDPQSLTPYLSWTAPDSTDHIVWYLDGATAYNEVLAGRRLGIAGHAVWRLGSEDPSLWRVLAASRLDTAAQTLADIPSGYDVEFEGSGEVLRVVARPTLGRRVVHVDSTSGLITDERITTYPTPFVVDRAGTATHQVALTFDDGPDANWTPEVLDTLARYHAPATFFVIGANVEANMALTRRIVRDGHEIGNHTFTHPNLALTAPWVTRLEINATERVLEAALNRRSVLFRPPYFGDAEPTTADELVPVGIASRLGYVTIGLHVDSDDWRRPGTERIVRNVLDQRSRGNVILLHDGGGDRRQTVAAIGPLIDSLRARGDTIVPLSTLIGVEREDLMPRLSATSASERLAELLSYGALGVVEWALYWFLMTAVALGVGRLVFIMALACIQRFRRRAPRDYAPSVSVIVPAYKEAKVIVRTIESLLTQRYAGALEVIVVDDGSPDDTYAVAKRAFPNDARVVVWRKANGGKASALNFGVARAHGEIVVGLDADTVFLPQTIARLVAPLGDPRVGAVAGNAKVGNRINLVTRWQALEYVTSQNLDRRAFALLDCISVVPGAIGAWRKQLVLDAGGFSDETLAEDQDLTLAIRRSGSAIAYADDAVAYTEAPDTFRGLVKQRFRWSFGTLQCMWKHRDALFRRRYGTLGWIAMPNVWLFQLLFTALSPVADLMFAWSLVSVWLTRLEHGATYALVNLEQVLTLYAIFLFVDWLAAMVAFLFEPSEDKRLTWLIVLQRFAYRQVMYIVVAKAFVAAIRGHIVGWGKLERKATVTMPAAAGDLG